MAASSTLDKSQGWGIINIEETLRQMTWLFMTGKGLQFHVPQHAKAPKGRHLPEWRPLSLVRLNLIANPRKWISKLISSIKAPPLNKEARPPAQRFPTPHGAGTLYHTCRIMSNTAPEGSTAFSQILRLGGGGNCLFCTIDFRARKRYYKDT